ncbi:MAG: hypothetical protein KAR79_02685 [Simkaniaceae bacterium]|nr:hypothetical protein [Simkaniaceae bacterium]
MTIREHLFALTNTYPLERTDTRSQALSQRAEENLYYGYTLAKIEVLTLKILGGGSGFFAAAFLSMAFQGVIVSFAIPATMISLFIGGLSFIVCTQIYDYEDAEQLEKYRREALQIFESYDTLNFTDVTHTDFVSRMGDPDMENPDLKILEKIASTHGWKNMFYYGIPLPADFERIYVYQAERLSVNEFIKFYELVSTEHQKVKDEYGEDLFPYEFPLPSQWPQKFIEEIIDPEDANFKIGLEDLFSNYEFEKIYELGLISESTLELLNSSSLRYRSAKETFDTETREFREIYEGQTTEQRTQCDKVITEARATYQNHSAFKSLLGLRMKEVEAINLMHKRVLLDEPDFGNSRQRLIEVMQHCSELGYQNIEELRGSDAETYERARRIFVSLEISHQEVYVQSRIAISQRFTSARRPHVNTLHTAKSIMEQTIQGANRQFEASVGQRTAEFENLISPKNRTFDLAKLAIERDIRANLFPLDISF